MVEYPLSPLAYLLHDKMVRSTFKRHIMEMEAGNKYHTESIGQMTSSFDYYSHKFLGKVRGTRNVQNIVFGNI